VKSVSLTRAGTIIVIAAMAALLATVPALAAPQNPEAVVWQNR
jgi:hypothetical protein